MLFNTDKDGNSCSLCRLHKCSRENVALPCKWIVEGIQERETEARHAQTHVYLLETLSWTNELMQKLNA